MLFWKRPIILATILVLTVFGIGILGFYYVGGQSSWLEAVYMAVITISTVGYHEAVTLDAAGKRFAILFIIVSFAVFAFALRLIWEYALEAWSQNKMLNKKNRKMISALKNHTIVCGFGRNGRQAVHRLIRHQKPYVVIEKNTDLITAHAEEVLFYEGDALSDETLEACRIAEADHFIAALPDDADNLFVVLSARQLNAKMIIVSRASEETSQKKLALAGADHVIMPDKIGGDHMAALLTVPDLVRFIDTLSKWEADENPCLEEVSIDRLPPAYLHKTLAELNLRNATGCNVVGARDVTGKQTINPDAGLTLQPGTKLIVLGNRSALEKLHRLFELV